MDRELGLECIEGRFLIGMEIVGNCFVELGNGDFIKSILPEFVVGELVVRGARENGRLEEEAELHHEFFPAGGGQDLVNDVLRQLGKNSVTS